MCIAMGTGLTRSRARLSLAAVLFVSAFAAPLCGQQKVAEGEYELRGPAEAKGATKTNSRWVLYSGPSGGYRLESEVFNVPSGVQVRQKVDFDTRLVPTAVTDEFYYTGDAKPAAVLTCRLANDAIVCSGRSDKGIAPDSTAFKPGGPFILGVLNFSSVDMAWDMAGALNMIRAANKKSALKGVMVTGGAALEIGDKLQVAYLKAVQHAGQTLTVIAPKGLTPWEFNLDEDTDVALIGDEPVEVAGANVLTQHYTVGTGDELMHIWITRSGVLVRLSHAADPEVLVLSNFRQYTKLVPELKIEGPPAASPEKQGK